MARGMAKDGRRMDGDGLKSFSQQATPAIGLRKGAEPAIGTTGEDSKLSSSCFNPPPGRAKHTQNRSEVGKKRNECS